MNPGSRSRIVVAGALAFAALLLLLIVPADPKTGKKGCDGDSLDRSIDSVLTAYGVPQKQVKKWVVRSGSGKPLRTERRVPVPPDFNNLDLNRDLNRVAVSCNGNVAGTERTKEDLVVLHVVTEGRTTQTIYLVTDSRQR